MRAGRDMQGADRSRRAGRGTIWAVVSAAAWAMACTTRPPSRAEPTEHAVVAPSIGLGYAEMPHVSAEARRENAEAFRAHRSGDHEKAEAGFIRAVELSPGFVVARYNRACARAKLGRFEAAAAELEELVALDLPRFFGKLRADPDLVQLRETDRGRALLRHADLVAERYRDMIDGGISMLMWSPARGRLDPPAVLRGGVYDPHTTRFVPMAPRREHARGAMVDVRERLVTYAGLDVDDCQTDFCPRVDNIDITTFAFPGIESAIIDRDFDGPRVDEDSFRAPSFVVLEARPGGLDVSTHTSPPEGLPERRADDVYDWDDYWWHANSNGFIIDHPHPDLGRARVTVTMHGTRMRLPSTEGYRIAKGMLEVHDREAIALPRLWRRSPAQVLSDGRHAIVLQSHEVCSNETEEGWFVYGLWAIDLSSGAVTEVHRAKTGRDGGGAMVLDPEGAVYVQRGRVVDRYRSLSAVAHEEPSPLPDGFVLGVPQREVGCRFGL